jgi:excisionase family DNA binding protein
MQALRTFDPARKTTLTTWLAVRISQLSYARMASRQTLPEMVTLEACKTVPARPPAPPPSPKSVMMRVEEVAERWDLNVKTIYGMIQRGELAARRCGRVVRIPRRVVDPSSKPASPRQGEVHAGKTQCTREMDLQNNGEAAQRQEEAHLRHA